MTADDAPGRTAAEPSAGAAPGTAPEAAPAPETERLDFDSDPGASRSRWIAGLLVLALVGWMGSGYLLPGSDRQEAAPPADAPRVVTVAVRPSQAEAVQQFFVAEGEALPERDSPVRAETGGTVAAVPVRRGAQVAAGQVIARIDPAQRQADLARAEEELARLRRDFQNAQALLDRGVATVDRVAQARSALAAGEAQLAAAQEAIDATTISAPFAGRLEALGVEEGEFVSAGAEVARVVDLSPLTVQVQVPQQMRSELSEGLRAEVQFITGDTREGVITFLGTSAAPETRTFDAEIEVPNEDGSIPAGISAQVRVPTRTSRAHFLSPAILSLDAAGRLGVKTVTAGNEVEFYPVEIIRAQTDGVWLAGLPDRAQVITVGQGFVSAGETVDPRPEEELQIGRLRDEAAAPAGNAATAATPEGAAISDALPETGAPTDAAGAEAAQGAEAPQGDTPGAEAAPTDMPGAGALPGAAQAGAEPDGSEGAGAAGAAR